MRYRPDASVSALARLLLCLAFGSRPLPAQPFFATVDRFLVASLLLVIGLPMQLAGWLRGPLASFMWLPMLAFEVPLGLWFLTRGVGGTGHD